MNDRSSTTLQTARDDDDDGGGLTQDMATAATTAALEVPRPTQLSVMQTVILSIMFVVALIGNSATLARMYRMRRRRSTINLLITHLATADLIVTFFCNVTEAVWTSTVQWLAGNAACKIIKFLQVPANRTCFISPYISLFILLLFSTLLFRFIAALSSLYDHFHYCTFELPLCRRASAECALAISAPSSVPLSATSPYHLKILEPRSLHRWVAARF